MKTHGLTRGELINSAGAAAIGLSAGTLVGYASTAAAASEPTEGSGADLASTCPPAIRTVAVAIALSLTLLISIAASAADPVFKAAAPMASPSGPQTLTGDWFGQGPVLRAAGFDFRLEGPYALMPETEIIWSPTALEHLQAIYDYILADNPAAAIDVHEEIERAAGLLAVDIRCWT